MKRREFLRHSIHAALVVAVPTALIVSRGTSSGQLWTDGTGANVTLWGDVHPHNGDYYAFVHPSNMKSFGLFTGEIGHYEGVRFIEQATLS